MGRSHSPAVDREQQIEMMTGETELARHDEQLERQEERPHRESGAVHRAGRPEAVLESAPPRRRGPVPVKPADVTPEQRAEFGIASPPLPGGIRHPDLETVHREKLHPKVPGAYYDGVMSHGVPIDVEHPPNHGRISPTWAARHGHEASEIPHHEVIETEPDPVPVYIVERAGGGKGRLDTATNQRTAPAAGSDPVRLTSQDLRRARVGLLNENGSHHARVSKSLSELASGKGLLLPAGATSYLWLTTQDDLFAVSNDSTAVAISVITEYEIPGGG